ncbi:MAG: PAS domain S-box protein [Methanomicrobiales archaeon]|jgi:PAS domain S-box-containing protein|nr:PAS domain S-box protein [Methanomicrobiales archaeon]
MKGPLKVLLVGGSSDDARRIGEMLAGCGCEVEVVRHERPGDGAVAAASDAAVVLLDLADDREAAAVDRLREAAPVIILAGRADDPVVRDAMERGAQDYLVRGRMDAELLCRSIRYALEMRMTERALHHSRTICWRLAGNLNEGILTTDTAGTIVFANPRMGEILGCPADDLIGLPAARFIRSPARRDEFETDITSTDGRCVHTLIVRSPITGGGGAVTGWFYGVLDTTDRMRAEEAFRQSEQNYRRVVESLSEGIWVLDPDACTSFVNPCMAEMLGYTPEEMAGRAIHTFLSPATGARLQEYFSSRQRSAREEHECEFITKGGSRITGLMITSPLIDEAGEFRGSIAGVMDITRRKRTEEELRTRNEHLLVINQIIGVTAASLSLAGLLEESLEKTLELLRYDLGIVYMLDSERKKAVLQHQKGISESALARNRLLKVHHWPFNFIFIAGQPRYIERQTDLNSIEASILGELDLSALACIPLIAESVVVGAIYLGSRVKQSFSRDERMLLETIGKEIGSGILKGMLHKKLEAANREANLYLDIMTHDIKNVENVSNLYTDLLLEILEGEAALYARKIRSNIARSAEVLGNVTTIRRIHHDSPDVEAVDLAAAIKKEVAAFPDVAIEFAGETSAQVWADDLLPEVFTNLIRNAVRYGGPDVRITIRVDDYDGESVMVSVEDTGPGIPDPMKESIFYRFERGWVGGYGDGLGLFVVRTLIERYGGTIRAEDRVEGQSDRGAVFRFTLREVLPADEDDDE